ncbi:putative SH3 domain protein (Cyk3) [Aspergillus lucknowensis]|uniref:SH3 domain-containing protein n=1 Tax=Aspergillus lucknowensis TaxID=176173 RepID=A0ABR4LFM8_9EURO
MPPAAPQLPTRFPCWCRAVYSWGGESKRDLGFVEGDLIECLNAGDGQWWMGRLRRDRRMVGLFPSNFVQVLEENFVPMSRSISPMGPAAVSPITNPTAAPKKQKTVFRKPFQAHKEALAPSGGSSSSTSPVGSTIPQTPPRDGSLSKKTKPMRTPTSAKREAPTRSHTRPPSLAISPQHQLSEISQPSPLSPSIPVPQHHLQLSHPSSREISPLQLAEREDSPPPPPPHRVAVRREPSPNMRVPQQLDMNDRYVVFARTPSPAAHSDANGQTPSPLRDAMEDVMTSLEDMGMPRGSHSPSLQPEFNHPWSPDAYNSLPDEHHQQRIDRPLTSLGIEGEGERDYYNPNTNHRNSVYTHNPFVEGPPQINNYVQRMESRLRQMQEQGRRGSEDINPADDDEPAPPPPPKHVAYHGRHNSIPAHHPSLKSRRSRLDLRDDLLNRSYTNKSSTTNSSSGVQSNSTNQTSGTDRTSQSLMSGASAGGFSATSAGSYARRGIETGERPSTAMDTFRARGFSDLTRMTRPETPVSGISYHSSHNTSRQGASSAIPWSASATTPEEPTSVFGGLSTPKAKKQGFFKKILESAKTGAANARSSIAVGQSGGAYSPTKGRAISPIRSSHSHREAAAREMGMGNSAIDWVQVRRDVNRASSPGRNERVERAERCQMMDHPVIYAVEELYDTAEGEESIDGLPISEPTNFGTVNLTLVDKSARFVNSLPPMTNPMSLAQGYVCRPYKSDVQRLRAIFTWISEKIAWDEPIEDIDTDIDLKRVLQTRRGCAQEVAYLVKEMCAAVGLHAEAIEGFLKTPGDMFELDSLSRPNHWWNSVLVDGEWRFMDCSLASPTNPRRNLYVTTNISTAEPWYFLARPLELCYSHVPLEPEGQHICPAISPDVLLALPTTCPAYFREGIQFPDYDTSVFRLEGLEVLQIRILVPADVECAAEVEAPAFARDADGDFFESGEVVRKRALVQPDWVNGQKRITIKAVLPGDEGQGMVKIYAGKKGLMHSSRDIPHPLAFALPIIHTGENPPYEFVLRHPTPHAQRHDLYIIQPQCAKLAVNNTFVFAVRQHASSPTPQPASTENSFSGRVSPSVFSRPASALSMVSSTVSTVSNEFSASTSAISSTRSGSGREKPAKLAIQSPSGKILRLTRKADHMISSPNLSESPSECTADGSVWETVIKIGERGCVHFSFPASAPFHWYLAHGDMSSKLQLPEPLAALPRYNVLYPFFSPIHPLQAFSSHGPGKAQISLYAKREDHSSPLACSGNKYRKLEYIIPDILSSQPKFGSGVGGELPAIPGSGGEGKKITTLVTEGAVQSNHTVQVASVARKIGLESVVLLHKGIGGGFKGAVDRETFLRTGNVQVVRLLGSDVRLLDPPGGTKTEDDLVEDVLAALRRDGRNPYWIPSGASLHPLGGLGYARCAFEIAAQEQDLPSRGSEQARFDYIFVACGSGSTVGGMIAGFKLLEKTENHQNTGQGTKRRPRQVIGILISPTKPKAYHEERVLRFAREAGARIGLHPEKDITMADVRLDDRFSGIGYGVFDEQGKETLSLFAEKEEIILDPVYTSKVARGTLHWVTEGEIAREIADTQEGDEQRQINALFIHTGGQAALNAYACV